jgi:hypothetical protein
MDVDFDNTGNFMGKQKISAEPRGESELMNLSDVFDGSGD